MAIGAITKSSPTGANAGKTFFIPVSFAGDGAYPTGGTAGFQTSLRAATPKKTLEIVAVIAGDCGGYSPVYDKANDKLKVYRTGAINSPSAEVPNATDLSGTTFNVVLVCK